MKKNNDNYHIFIIPFLFIFLFGILKVGITFQQIIFKTLILLIFNISLIIIYFIYIFNEDFKSDKKRIFLLFYFFYSIYILYQIVVSFFTCVISYERDYYFINYFSLIIFSLLIFIFIKNTEELKIGLSVLSFFFIIAFIITTVQLINSGLSIKNFRPKFTFQNSTYFSNFLNGIIPLGIISPFVWFDKNDKKKILITISLSISVFLGIITLFLTLSRSSIFSLYLSFIIIIIPGLLFILNIKSIKFKIAVIITVLSAGLLLPVYILYNPPLFLKGYLYRFIFLKENFSFLFMDRINGWTGCLNLFKKYPLFGAGLGTTYAASFEYIDKYYKIYSRTNSFKHSHNEYIEILGESGIIGLLFFLVLIGFIVINLFRIIFSKKNSNHFRIISLGINAGIICMLFNDFFNITLRVSETMIVFFFLVSLGLIQISNSNNIIKFKNNKNLKNNYLNSDFTLRNIYFTLISIFVINFLLILLFIPIIKSEIYTAKSYQNTFIKKNEYYLKLAVTNNKKNIYAWNKKWLLDYYILQRKLNDNKNKPEIEQYFLKAEKDLDMINSIIPKYQNISSKYAQLYLAKYEYLQKNHFDKNDSEYYLNKALFKLNESISFDFLNKNDHSIRVLLVKIKNNSDLFQKNLKEFIFSLIYIKYVKKNRIKHDKIVFLEDKTTNVGIENGKYIFTIGKEDFLNLYDKVFSLPVTDELSRYYFVNSVNIETLKFVNSIDFNKINLLYQ